MLVARVLDVAQAVNRPQNKAHDTNAAGTVPGLSEALLRKSPFHVSETPVLTPQKLALLGEDNREVLSDVLSDREEIIAAPTRSELLLQDQRIAETEHTNS